MCVAFYTVIESIEAIKKIVTLSGLRWKMVSKTAPAAQESTDDRDVYKRLIFVTYNCNIVTIWHHVAALIAIMYRY